MNTTKYRHARASGYSPALAIAYQRGAHLPAKAYGRYMQDIQNQRIGRLVHRARSRMMWYAETWPEAWHNVRHEIWEREHYAPEGRVDQTDKYARRVLDTTAQFFYTTADN